MKTEKKSRSTYYHCKNLNFNTNLHCPQTSASYNVFAISVAIIIPARSESSAMLATRCPLVLLIEKDG